MSAHKVKKKPWIPPSKITKLSASHLQEHCDLLFKKFDEKYDLNWSKISHVNTLDARLFDIDSLQIKHKNYNKLKEIISNLEIDSSKLPVKLKQVKNSTFKNISFKENILNLYHTKITLINANAFAECNLEKIIFSKVPKIDIDKNAFQNNPLIEIDIQAVQNFSPKECAFGKIKIPKIVQRKDQDFQIFPSDDVSLPKKPTSKNLQTKIIKVEQTKLSQVQETNKSFKKEIKNLNQKLASKEKKLEESQTKNKNILTDLDTLKKKFKQTEKEKKRLERKLKKSEEKNKKVKTNLQIKNKLKKSEKENQELENKNEYLKKIIEDTKRKNENAKKQLDFLWKKEPTIESWSEIVINKITTDFFYLCKKIENLITGYLFKFEARIRSVFDKFVNSVDNQDESYSLHELLKSIELNEKESIELLNKLPEEHYFQRTLKKIMLFKSEKEKSDEWYQDSLKQLRFLIILIKQIRNFFLHSNRIGNRPLKEQAKDCTFTALHKNVNEIKRFLESVNLDFAIKHYSFKSELIIYCYTTLICSLTFFNKKYIMSKIIEEMKYEINVFAHKWSEIIDKSEVMKIFGLDKTSSEKLKTFWEKLPEE